MRHLLAFTAICMAAPAAAVPMWDKVDSDMTRDQVAALYPEGGSIKYHEGKSIEIHDLTIVDKCEAESNIYFDGERVSRVLVKGKGSIGGRCSDKVIAALSVKYGPPLNGDRSSTSFASREGETFVWSRPGVTMRFKKFTNGAMGGGGLLKSSWELEYTTLAENVAL